MPVHKRQIRAIARLHGYWIFKTFLSRAHSWPLEKRRAWVFNKLKSVLIKATDGVPFYQRRFRESRFDPRRDFLSIADMAKVPILTKTDVRTHYDEMVDRRYLFRSVIAHTSGTSGEPMAMRLDEPYVAFDYACMFRHWAIAGYRFRSPILALRSYVPDSPDGPLWKYNRWQNTLYMSAYHLKPSNCEAYLNEVLRFRPAYIRAYPSSINVFAEYAYPARDKLSFVKGIFTASETLLESERGNIERTFGPVLYDWYGMTEPAVVITERPGHDGMDVNWEYGFPEFHDDPTLEPGEKQLISTSLHNPVMPFIRYHTGDIVSIDSTPHSDSLYPGIRRIRGRKDETFVTPDGRRLPSLNFYSLLQSYTEILRFQFVQEQLDAMVVKLQMRSAVKNSDALIGKLQVEIGKRLGDNVSLSIEITDHFVSSPDGKTPTFVSTHSAQPRTGKEAIAAH
jgi:phenylacetate-CoA ligase